MKNKILSGVLALSMMIGMGSMNVSADEESPYYVAPELNLTDTQVEEIIDGISSLARDKGMTEEEISELISVWYKKPQTRATTSYYSFPVKDFFVAVSVPAGQVINSTKYLYLQYDSNYVTLLNDSFPYNGNINLGNAIPSLTMNNIYTDVELSDGYSIEDFLVAFTNLSNTYTQVGNIITISVKAPSTSSTDWAGATGYSRIRNYTSLAPHLFTTSPQTTGYLNNNVGALGDINNNAIVNEADLQLLQQYIVNGVSFTQLQYASGDVTQSGEIDIRDVSHLVNYLNGNISSLR